MTFGTLIMCFVSTIASNGLQSNSPNIRAAGPQVMGWNLLKRIDFCIYKKKNQSFFISTLDFFIKYLLLFCYYFKQLMEQALRQNIDALEVLNMTIFFLDLIEASAWANHTKLSQFTLKFDSNFIK